MEQRIQQAIKNTDDQPQYKNESSSEGKKYVVVSKWITGRDIESWCSVETYQNKFEMISSLIKENLHSISHDNDELHFNLVWNILELAFPSLKDLYGHCIVYDDHSCRKLFDVLEQLIKERRLDPNQYLQQFNDSGVVLCCEHTPELERLGMFCCDHS